MSAKCNPPASSSPHSMRGFSYIFLLLNLYASIFAQYCWNNKHASSKPALKANFANDIFVRTMLTRCDDDDDVGRQKKMHFKENMYEYI